MLYDLVDSFCKLDDETKFYVVILLPLLFLALVIVCSKLIRNFSNERRYKRLMEKCNDEQLAKELDDACDYILSKADRFYQEEAAKKERRRNRNKRKRKEKKRKRGRKISKRRLKSIRRKQH